MDRHEGAVPPRAQFVDHAGHDFLPRSARPCDQNGCGSGRDLPNQARHLLHFLSEKDHFDGRKPLADLLGQKRDPLLLFSLPEYAAYHVPQVFGAAQGLRKIIGRTGFHRFHGVPDRAVCCDDDPPAIPICLPGLPHEVDAGHVRHSEIGHDEVEFSSDKPAKGLFAVLRLFDTIPLLREDGAEEGSHQFVVIHDQDGSTHFFRSPRRGGGSRGLRLPRPGSPDRSCPPSLR